MSGLLIPVGPTYFTPDALSKIVAETIPATLPDGHRNAAVATLDSNGVGAVVSFALDAKQHFVVQGAIQHDWAGNTSVGAKFVGSW